MNEVIDSRSATRTEIEREASNRGLTWQEWLEAQQAEPQLDGSERILSTDELYGTYGPLGL